MNMSTNASEAGSPAAPSHAVGPYQEASAAALADFAANPAQAETPAEEAVETAAPLEAEETAQPEQAAQSQADFEEELTVAGRQLKLNRQQLREFAQKGVDYTRKTMELAQHRKAFEQEYAEARAYITAELAKLPKGGQPTPQAAEPSQIDPNDIPTINQVQQLLDQKLKEAQQEYDKKLAKSRYEMEFQKFQNEYSTGINSHLNAVKTKFPDIADIPGVDMILRQNVGAIVAQNPTDDMNVVRALIDSEAEKIAGVIKAKIERETKSRAVAAAARKTTEPPGGSIARTPTDAKPAKLGSKELTAQVIADLTGKI